MKHFFTLFFVMCVSFVVNAQRNTGINTTNPSSKAALDVHTDGSLKQGILVPRLSVADTTVLKSGIPNHSKGLLFYDTVNTVYRYWTGSKWLAFGGISSSISDWSLSGNTLVPADTLSTGFKYLGTNSPFPLILATDGQQRMRISRNGNIGIGMNPTGGIPLSLKSNGLGQVFSIERSKGDNLFEFREDANLNAKLQMYDVDGSPTVEFNADPKLYSHLNTLGFGIGNVAPAAMLDVAGDFATRPTTADFSATDVIYALPTSGTSVIYVGATPASGTKIHGIANGVPGKHLYITNRTSSPVIFIDNSGDVGVAITDLIIIGGLNDYQILNGQTAHFIYVGGRWRLVTAPSTSGGSLSGTGLAGKVAFWNGSSNLTYNTNLHWNNTNSRLGIGTVTPSTSLHINNSTGNAILTLDAPSANVKGISFNNAGTELWSIYSDPVNSNLSIGNSGYGGSPIMINTVSGFMGLAITPALDALHLGNGKKIRLEDFAGLGSGIVTHNNNGVLQSLSGLSSQVVLGNGTLGTISSPWTVSGTDIYNSNTGGVGIGTSSIIAGYKLRVSGDGILIDNNPTGIYFTSSTSIGDGFSRMLYDESTGATGAPSMKYIFSPRNNANTGTTPLVEINMAKVANQGVGFFSVSTRNLASSTAERFRIDSEGNVGIGTAIPSTTLHVDGSMSVGVPAGGMVLVIGNNNNLAIGDYTFIPVAAAAAGSTITGFAGSNTGRIIYIHNYSSGTLSIAESSANSTAGNRIITGNGTVTITGAGSAVFVYWNANWRLVSVTN